MLLLIWHLTSPPSCSKPTHVSFQCVTSTHGICLPTLWEKEKLMWWRDRDSPVMVCALAHFLVLQCEHSMTQKTMKQFIIISNLNLIKGSKEMSHRCDKWEKKIKKVWSYVPNTEKLKCLNLILIFLVTLNLIPSDTQPYFILTVEKHDFIAWQQFERLLKC